MFFTGRHAHGDQYKAKDFVVNEPGLVEMVFTSTSGEEKRYELFQYKAGGVALGILLN